MTPPKTAQFTVRITPEFRARLEAVCNKVSIDAAAITRAALVAVVEQAEKTGKITLPLELVKPE